MFSFFWFFKFLLKLPRISAQKSRRYQPLISFIKRVRAIFILLALVVGIGVLGYHVIEQYTLLEAYYMTIITLASVGYGEVQSLTDKGRIFTTFLILFNLGFYTYAITTLTSLFAGGSFINMIKDLKMTDEINNLRGHTIICGFGRHGLQVADELEKQAIPFVVIENVPDKLDKLRNETNYFFLEGDATDDDVLMEAGIKNAASIVITLPSPSDTLFVIYSARELNTRMRIIARATDDGDESKFRRAGADHVVMPERIGGFYMATLAKNPDLVEFFTLLSNIDESNVVFEEIPIKDLKPEFQNRSIRESNLVDDTRLNIIALRFPEGKYILHPEESLELLPNMHLVLLGDRIQLDKFKKQVM